jgi:hypothetical protein
MYHPLIAIHCKKIYRIPGFSLPNLSDTGKNLCCKGFFLCHSKKEFVS